jgi:hypothetical protein
MPTTPPRPSHPTCYFLCMYRLLASPCEPSKGAARVKEYKVSFVFLVAFWIQFFWAMHSPCGCPLSSLAVPPLLSVARQGTRNRKQRKLLPPPQPSTPPSSPSRKSSVCIMLAERHKINAATQASADRQQRVQTVVVAVFVFGASVSLSAIFPRVANHQNRFRCIAHTHTKNPRRPPSPPRPVP